MKRLLHLGLLLLALTGLAGQSLAHATTFKQLAGPMQMSSGSMSCYDVAGQSEPDSVPCKKVGLQCLAAMGCPAMTMAMTDASTMERAPDLPLKSVGELVDALHGRSYAPELEPPTLLI